MSYLYLDIAKEVALRANQLGGGDAAAVDAAYAGLSLEGVEVPATALKTVVLATTTELVSMVGNSSNALFRGPISTNSAAIADGGDIPSLSASGDTFIGSFEGFYDISGPVPRALTEGALEQVVRYIDDLGGFFKINPYLFAETGTKLRHTGASVVARGCVWNATAQAGLYAAGSCPLPVELKMLHVAMVLEMLPQEEWFVQEAEYYSNLVEKKSARIIAGKEQLMTLPQIPKKTASADPIKD